MNKEKPPAAENVLITLDPQKPTVEPLLTPDQAADLMGIHRDTLLRFVRRGEVPAIHIGKKVRFRPSTLERWLDELEQTRGRSRRQPALSER